MHANLLQRLLLQLVGASDLSEKAEEEARHG
jgi:hypothetical protein